MDNLNLIHILISSIICFTPLPLAQDMMTSTAMYGTVCGLREQVQLFCLIILHTFCLKKISKKTQHSWKFLPCFANKWTDE